MICDHCGSHMDYRADYLEWRCPNCGSTYDLLDDIPYDLTEEEGNRLAYEILYGDEERQLREEYEREYEAWWLASDDDQ